MLEQNDNLFKEVESLFDERRYGDAIKILLEAEKSNPNDYNLLNYLIDAFYLKRDREKTTDYIVKVIGLNPKSISPWIECAKEYEAINKLEKAIEVMLKAIKYITNFNAYNFYNHLGYLYYKNSQFDEAMDYFVKVIELFPYDYIFYIAMEDRHRVESLYEEYRSYLTKYVNSNPTYHAIYGLLGVSYFKNEKHQEAKECFLKALELNPDDSDSKKMLEIIENLLK